jgi:4-amino-4-deoxy-L-arabinose transferase-like glycosyltransferase
MTCRGRTSLTLSAVFIVAFLIRLAAVLALRDITTGPEGDFAADPVEYNRLAISLAAGRGYAFDNTPTSFRAPGWPLALAAVYRVVGVNYVAAYLFSCALGAATCVIAYAIAVRVGLGNSAVWAGWLCALYVPHIYFATIFDSETLFVPVFGLAILLFLRHLCTRSMLILVLAGLVIGYAVLIRPPTILVVPLLAALLLWQARKTRQHSVFSPVILIITVLLVLLPWTWRNYRLHGALVWGCTNGGSTFYGGNNHGVVFNPNHWGGWISTRWLPDRELINAQPSEVAHDQMEWKLGRQWCRENWYLLPLAALLKFVRFWLPDFDSANSLYVAIQIIGYTPFLLLYLLSLRRLLRNPSYRTPQWYTLHACILATILIALIFWGSPRFRDGNTAILMSYAMPGAAVFLAPFRWRASHAPSHGAHAV